MRAHTSSDTPHTHPQEPLIIFAAGVVGTHTHTSLTAGTRSAQGAQGMAVLLAPNGARACARLL
jgi:hypothetical protein